jgi:hypothetical protein
LERASPVTVTVGETAAGLPVYVTGVIALTETVKVSAFARVTVVEVEVAVS